MLTLDLEKAAANLFDVLGELGDAILHTGNVGYERERWSATLGAK